MPGALDGDGERALALRGQARLTARLDLATLRQEPAQAGNILVVNLIYAIGGEDVHATATTTTSAEPATAAAAESAAAAAATATATEPATAATITTESATAATATATATVTATVVGTRRAGVTTARCAIVRCPLRALLISHRLYPPGVHTLSA